MAKARRKKSSAFAALLGQLMAERGLTNRSAAAIAGVSAATIQAWRTGTAPTDFEAVSKLADAMQVPLRFLLTGTRDSFDGEREITLSEVLADGGEIFSGICEVKIRRLVPRTGGSNSKKGEP